LRDICHFPIWAKEKTIPASNNPSRSSLFCTCTDSCAVPEMTIHDLEFSVALYEERNLLRAGERVGFGQSNASKRLRLIEQEVCHQLFKRSHGRSPGNMEPTPAGDIFVEYIRVCLHAYSCALNGASEARLGERLMLRIGASAYSSPEILDRLYSTELRAYPNLSIEFMTEPTAELLKDLQLKKIDLALLLTPPESRVVTTTLVASEPFMIAMWKSHPLASKRSVTLSEVAGYPWIFFSRSAHLHLHDLILTRVEEIQRRATIVHRILHADQVPAFLKNDSTLAWLTPAGAERLANRGFVFVPLLDSEIRLEAHLAALADNKSRLVSDFVRTFMKQTEDMRSPGQSPLAA